MAHVADHAAMAAIPVVVGMHRDGRSGLKAGKARQQKQHERGADPASGNAIWIGPVQRDSLPTLDEKRRRNGARTSDLAISTSSIFSSGRHVRTLM